MPLPKNTHKKRYGHRHRRTREAWVRRVASGSVKCARCGEPISPREPWDLGHVDGSDHAYQGPEHSSCNRAAGARASRDPRPRPKTRW